MRKRFGKTAAEADLSDQLIVADSGRRTVALVVNSVTGVVERATEDVIEAQKIVPGVQYVDGMTRLHDGILFIHDLDRFLSKQEERELDCLLAEATGAE